MTCNRFTCMRAGAILLACLLMPVSAGATSFGSGTAAVTLDRNGSPVTSGAQSSPTLSTTGANTLLIYEVTSLYTGSISGQGPSDQPVEIWFVMSPNQGGHPFTFQSGLHVVWNDSSGVVSSGIGGGTPPPVGAVPEPSAALVFAAGFAVFALARRRKSADEL